MKKVCAIANFHLFFDQELFDRVVSDLVGTDDNPLGPIDGQLAQKGIILSDSDVIELREAYMNSEVSIHVVPHRDHPIPILPVTFGSGDVVTDTQFEEKFVDHSFEKPSYLNRTMSYDPDLGPILSELIKKESLSDVIKERDCQLVTYYRSKEKPTINPALHIDYFPDDSFEDYSDQPTYFVTLLPNKETYEHPPTTQFLDFVGEIELPELKLRNVNRTVRYLINQILIDRYLQALIKKHDLKLKSCEPNCVYRSSKWLIHKSPTESTAPRLFMALFLFKKKPHI